MRALVVSPVFPPEPIVSAQTTAQIAEALAERGHEVTVITAFPNRPAGKLYPGYRRKLYRREQANEAYDVLRCYSALSAESRMLSRFAENISFGLTSGWVALTAPRPDVIYANTWPIFAAGVMAAVARLRRIPLVINVQDIYPESLISQGRIRAGSRTARVLAAADRRIAHAGHDIIVISKRFAAVYRDHRGVPTDWVHVVPNWADDRVLAPDGGGVEVRAAMDIPPDAFLLVYGGNVGMAAGVEGVIQALALCDDEVRPYLLVAGAGANLEACRSLAARVAGDRIRFYTPWPTEKTGPVYSAADVLVLPTRGQQSLASMPSKLVAYMLAGRPVIAQAVGDSDLADTIESAGCGWSVEPESPQALAQAIRGAMALSADERRRYGRAGQDYARRHLTRSACLPKIIELLEKAAM